MIALINTYVTLAKLLLDNPYEMATEIIEEFKKSITTKSNAGSDEKFAYRLGKLVRGELARIKKEGIHYPILPNKGKASATLLLKRITNINQVDESLQKAFDRLKIVEIAPELKATASTLLPVIK